MKVQIDTYYSIYGATNRYVTEQTNEQIAALESSGNKIVDVRVQVDNNMNITVTILYELSEEKLQGILEKPRIQTF